MLKYDIIILSQRVANTRLEGGGWMSKNIDEMKANLNQLVANNIDNLNQDKIIKLSQELDILIVKEQTKRLKMAL